VADVADCPLQRLSAIVIKNIIIIFYTSVGVPEVGEKIDTRNYNSDGHYYYYYYYNHAI